MKIPKHIRLVRSTSIYLLLTYFSLDTIPCAFCLSCWKEEDSTKSRKRQKEVKDDNSKHASKHKKKQRHDDSDSRKEHWLRRDILVRIISKKLAGGKYFKRKAVVDRVLDDKFTAEVEVLDSGPDERDGGDVLRLDQDDLETVVPKVDKSVRILNGPGRGKKAKVVSLDSDRYKATLKLEDGTTMERVDYGDFSKFAWHASSYA